MIDTRWTQTDTFETTVAKAPFAELIRLALIAGAAIRSHLRDSAGRERFDGFAGHAAS